MSRRRREFQSLARIALAILLIACCHDTTKAQRAEVTAQQILRAIDRGKHFILRNQGPDGSWSEFGHDTTWLTARAVLVLLQADVPRDDPAIEKAIGYLRKARPERTITLGEQTAALITADPDDSLLLVHANLDRLQRTQIKEGPAAGSWSAGPGLLGEEAQKLLPFLGQRASAGNKIVTQFPIWALSEGASVGFDIDPAVWQRAESYLRNDQRDDGGWGAGGSASNTIMTTVGIASLIMIGAQVDAGLEQLDEDGTAEHCGRYRPDDAIERALGWMQRNFAPDPNRSDFFWVVYYLSNSERGWNVSAGPQGRRFGQHDWYREAAHFLIRRQDPQTGAWEHRQIGPTPLVATFYATQALTAGKIPVAINKLHYGPADDWNNDRDDVGHLTQFLSKHWDRPLGWQVVELDLASTEDLLQTPIAYLNGHLAPEITDQQLAMLRDYVAEGGTILAEACCGRREFDQGFRRLVDRLFAEDEYALKPLAPEHPLWRAEFVLDPQSSPPLWGLDFGCRTAVIYSPGDLSCAWEQWSAPKGTESVEDGRPAVDLAMRVGTNMVAYATGQQFPDKLTRRESFTSNAVPEPGGKRNVLRIAKLLHPGESDPAPQALANLMRALHTLVPGIHVNPRPREVDAADPTLPEHPLAYMHGRRSFQFSEPEIEHLRRYLQRGGVLFADATCGASDFDRSFRALCSQLFPTEPLAPIPTDHALFKSAEAGGTWFDLPRVTRREPRRAGPDEPLRTAQLTGDPRLEGIFHDGRYAVIYSPLDISCALEHSQDVLCLGYVHRDALRIAVNVVIYAVHQQ